MARSIVPVLLGRLNYSSAWQIQKHFAQQHLDHMRGKTSGNEAENVILLVEHDPVYTIGLRTDGYTIKDEATLKSLGAEFYRTNRGGLITFHGPGQLVAYPIINLKHFKIGMREYISRLEQSIISMCNMFGLNAKTSPHTGVWIQEKKIAAIGRHCSRYVTTHGVGINCNTDLSWFDHIVPCGIEDKGVTSLSQELDRDVTVEDSQVLLLEAMSRIFECDITNSRQFNTDEVRTSSGIH